MRQLALVLLLAGMTTSAAAAPLNTENVKGVTEEKLTSFLSPVYQTSAAERVIIQNEIFGRHQDWPQTIKNLIHDQKIQIGMSEAQVLASWGPPQNKATSVSAGGKTEQWIYPSDYLYFEGGKLKSFQSIR